MEEATYLKRRIEELENINNELSVIFDSMDDLVFVIDINNNIVKTNAACAKFFNTDVENILGKKCYEIMHKMNNPWPSCPLEKTKTDKKTHIEEVDDPNIGMPLLVTTSPIFDAEGRFVGAVHVAKNILELKKTERELQDKITELERFQKVTVDRELKMKELKARIVELEAKLSVK